MAMLGTLYLNGKEIEANEELGLKWLKEGAAHGNVDAIYQLGSRYKYGVGLREDGAEAVRLLRKGDALDVSIAAAMLGQCYSEGFCVERDSVEALRLYNKAFELGFRDAAKMAASMLVFNQDYKNAEIWARKGAEYDVDGCKGLLEILEKQAELQSETKEASSADPSSDDQEQTDAEEAEESDESDVSLDNLLKEAENGSVNAMLRLAEEYDKDQSPEARKERAKWYLRAAEAGNTDAMTMFAGCCLTGDGVEKDSEKANEWLERALDEDDDVEL